MTDDRKELVRKIDTDNYLPLHANFRSYIKVMIAEQREKSDFCEVNDVLRNQGAVAALKLILKDLEPPSVRTAPYTGAFN